MFTRALEIRKSPPSGVHAARSAEAAARSCAQVTHAKIRADLVGQRLLDLHIALVRSRTRGAAVADRRHKVGGALSAGAVAGEQPIRRLVLDLLTASTLQTALS